MERWAISVATQASAGATASEPPPWPASRASPTGPPEPGPAGAEAGCSGQAALRARARPHVTTGSPLIALKARA